MSLGPALLAAVALTLTVLGLRDLKSIDGRSTETRTVPARRNGTGAGRRGRRRVATGRPADGRSGGRLKVVGATVGIFFGSVPAGLLPGRLGPLILVGSGLGGLFLPDLLRARSARARHRRMIAALPDALDLLAVSVATGRGLAGSLADLARSGRGPLVEELAEAGEDMAWGSGQAAALEALRSRIGGPEIAAFCSSLERSRRLGSPLADQLRRQSATLRQDQRRAIEEEAARAAPKIQLVIALVLVPSVLLLIVAALIANADTLLPTGM